jgi:glucose/arabinose dehydrogenase/PKD repeat protein
MFRPSVVRPLTRLLPAVALLAIVFAVSARAITLPPDFVTENAAPGVAWDTPVNIAFLPDGRMLVAEKRGRVWVVKDGVRHPTPVWSREAEVLNHHDRGLLGIAVDPNYALNRHVYFLYTVDADSNNSDGSEDGFGRLTRYQISASDSNAVDPASRTILVGVNWPNGPLSGSPSHTVGTVQFGADGSLMMTAGDGAQYTNVDSGGRDNAAFGTGKTNPLEDIGAFRAQYLQSLAGKVLRINPATGLGYSSNPFWDGNGASVASRVWAYGVRNPYRFTVRPGTGSANPANGDPGSLFIGDVGWNKYEEINVAYGGENFGWPCYEGLLSNDPYQIANPSHHGCGTIGTPQNPATHTQPVIAWHHSNPSLSTPPGIEGNTSTGGVFYEGNRFPLIYRGRYFFADYADHWIRTADFDANDQFLGLQDFAFNADGPVAIALNPADRMLYYVAILAGQVRRIRYTGPLPNTPPVASADVSPSVGVAPLAVTFSSVGSSDPDDDPLSFSWVFGDGNGSNAANPAHVYADPGLFQAVLTVSDTAGAVARDTVTVIVTATGGFPTSTVLDDFNRPNGPVGGAWIGDVSGLSISGNTLVPVSSGLSTIWDGAAFGPNQEAFVTFDALSAGAPEHDLMLKVQGTSGNNGHIEVRYDDNVPLLAVGTYHPSLGWQGNATFAVSFGAGDQLGARAYQDGTVEVFKNGALLGSTSVDFWPFFANGGRIGITLVGATASVLDDFGGGDVVLDPNTPPSASLYAPRDSAFFAAGDTVWMKCSGTDAEDAAPSLAHRIEVDLHHNTHIHPNSIVIDDSTGFFVAEDHDDGTGVWFEVRGIVTDTGGMSDTSRVSIFPEIDLVPGGFSTDVPQLGEDDSATFTFRIHNRGAMPAPLFRWRFTADDSQLLAEGDTLVGARDSVTVTRTLPPSLTAGMHTLRIAVDTLGAVVETSEVNNAFTGTIEVVEGNGTVAVGDAPVRELSLGNAYPNPVAGTVGFALALPRESEVSFAVLDVQGREVWRMPDQALPAGRVHLTWNGVAGRGDRVRPGLYLARVSAGGITMVRRFVVLR